MSDTCVFHRRREAQGNGILCRQCAADLKDADAYLRGLPVKRERST